MKKFLLSTVMFLTSIAGISLSAQTVYNYTGVMQTYTVPAGVSLVTVECLGAQGNIGLGPAGGLPGLGGYSSGELIVTPGQTLNIFVGGQNGYNGGGAGGNIGAGGGGGASDVRVGGITLGDRIIVAGGGGGGGVTGCLNNLAAGNGGNGGGDAGTDGASSADGFGGFGGTVGTGGGAGLGCPSYLGTPGLANGTGGNGQGCCCATTPGGGGGGGGYITGGGGGGGSAGTPGCSGNDKGGGGGGAGGSSWTGVLTNSSTTNGVQSGEGMITITVACSATSILVDLAVLPNATDECAVNISVPPTATNDCGLVVDGVSSVSFPVTMQGTTQITWTYDDGMGNVATQTQDVIITDVTAPIPDLATLPDLSDQCQVMSLTPPTATDNCNGSVIGTTTTMAPITSPGSSVIVWSFNDGNGNISTQTQNVLNPTIDNTVTVNGTTLQANQLGADYQWTDCDNGYSAIGSEIAQTYTPIITGNYAVEITLSGCVDTSACELVDFTGIVELVKGKKELVKIIDFMGRETNYKPNIPLIFIFSDGTRERIIGIE